MNKRTIYVARDKNGTLAIFNLKPILDPDSGEWIAKDGKFTEIDNREYRYVTFENSPVEYSISDGNDFDKYETTTTNVCVGDVYKYKHGVFYVGSIEGSNLCYIDSIQFDGNGNVVIHENIIFYIDDFDTFEELERVNSDTFQEIMFNAKAYVEATRVEEKSKQMLNDLFENLKGFRI